MSNYLAIATVTATIYDVLAASAQEVVPGTQVTMTRPNDRDADNSARVNMYLYQTMPNASLRNAYLPSRRSTGTLVERPRAALDLHYLFTFFGDETQLEPQRLLGKIISTFESRPILTSEQIGAAVQERQDLLGTSDLANQIETVRLSPLVMDIDELSRFWSTFYQVPYSLSLVYQASVVIIESEETIQPALPVRGAGADVGRFQQALVEDVVNPENPNRAFMINSTLALRGQQLDGDISWVSVNGSQLPPSRVSTGEVTVNLDDTSLHPGVQAARIVYDNGSESNVSAFVLRPRIVEPIEYTPGDNAQNISPCITLNTDVLIGESQRVVLLLNEIGSDAPQAYSLAASTDVREAETRTISFPVNADVKTGTSYLARIQVDGAESLLIIGKDPQSDDPEQDRYIGPTVTLP